MQDFSLQRCTKRCRKSNRALAPGEWFYSVVEQRNANTIRYDISSSEWHGQPANAIAWWKSRMPEAKAVQRAPTPNGVLLQRLSEFCDDPQQQTLAYLLAMLLVRRKVLEYTVESTTIDGESLGQATQEGIQLRALSDGSEYRVFEPDSSISFASLKCYQQALQELLVMQPSLFDDDEGLIDSDSDAAAVATDELCEHASIELGSTCDASDSSACDTDSAARSVSLDESMETAFLTSDNMLVDPMRPAEQELSSEPTQMSGTQERQVSHPKMTPS